MSISGRPPALRGQPDLAGAPGGLGGPLRRSRRAGGFFEIKQEQTLFKDLRR